MSAPPIVSVHDPDDTARYVLRSAGEYPLVCVGVNPSTATVDQLDPTVRKVARFADRNGFDGWAMLNLYPQRSTEPAGMHADARADWVEENLRRIGEMVDGRPHTVLAAWGDLIETRSYLLRLLADIVIVMDAAGCRWVTLGDVTTAGHPWHPSRAAYARPLTDFDVARYVTAQRARGAPCRGGHAFWRARAAAPMIDA